MNPSETAHEIRRLLADAPAQAPTHPIDLLGYWVGPHQGHVFVCADCAGRIFARNCALPYQGVSEIVWAGQPYGPCAGHE